MAQQEFPAYSFSVHPSRDGRRQGDAGRSDTDRFRAGNNFMTIPASIARIAG